MLSEAEAERRLVELQLRRAAIEREAADLARYLELGRRLAAEPNRPADAEPRHRAATAGAPDDRSDATAERHRTSAGPDDGTDPARLSERALARRRGRVLIGRVAEVLEQAGRPLHAGEILAVLSAEGFALPGRDPVAALNTRLWKRSGPGGAFERLGEATYALPGQAAPSAGARPEARG